MSHTSISLSPEVTMEFVRVPAGTFEMGRPGDFRVDDVEDPYHFVRITRPFWLGKYPVTTQQWNVVMRKPLREGVASWPMDSISWNDCQAFLNAAEGEGYSLRLPTEAEWEYASRANTTARFSWGEDEGRDMVAQYAWTIETSDKTKTIKLPYGKVVTVASKDLADVGQRQPNAWGFFDMSGLVWEWCADWHSEGPYRPEPPDDPKGPAKGVRRSLRGGSISEPTLRATSSAREALPPDTRRQHIGFRCVLVTADNSGDEIAEGR